VAEPFININTQKNRSESCKVKTVEYQLDDDEDDEPNEFDKHIADG